MAQTMGRALGMAVVVSLAAVTAGAPPGWAAAVAEATIPLPRGIRALPEPTQVDVGSSTLSVQSFTVPRKVEGTITFYEEALPRAGWQVRRLPWQANHEEAIRGLKHALTYRRQQLDEDRQHEAQDWLGQLEQAKQAQRRQLYATHGSEHVILTFWSNGDDQGTMVFINRWSGDQRWLGEGQPRQEAAKPARPSLPMEGAGQLAGGLPMTNVCCSQEEVPDLSGALPFSIPRYPGAKAVARTRPPGGLSTTVLMMVPATEPEVTAFYLEQMRVNGWKVLEEPASAASPQGEVVRRLRFQRPDRLCELTIGAPPAGDGAEAMKTMVTVAIRPRVGGGL